MRLSKLPIKLKIPLVLLTLYLAMLLIAPSVPILSGNSHIVTILPNTSKGTLVDISGHSTYDAYDRIISVMDGNIEVARVITPLHRDGSLPNTFNDIINLPYTATDTLQWMTLNNAQEWSVNIAVQATAQTESTITQVLPFQEADTGYFNTFSLTQAGTVYFLISGHSMLEGVNLTITIDSKVYLVYNWHPLDNDAQLTTVGAVIPYIAINMTAGYHYIDLTGTSQFARDFIDYGLTTPYFVVSAFEVTYPNVIP